MCLAMWLSRSAIPYGPFAISQVEKREFVRKAESQLKIPFGPFPNTSFPLKWKPTTPKDQTDFAEDSFLP